MLSKLMPKEGKFFDYFDSMANKILEGCRQFEAMLGDYKNRERYIQDIYKIEGECDDITHEVIDQVNKVFITPVDREDIQLLIKTMDNVIDFVHATAQRMGIFEIKEVPDGLPAMARIIVQSMEEVKVALSLLRNMRKPEETLKHCTVINRLENECDVLVREKIGRLFREHGDDPVTIIKVKELYERLEDATDCCEDIADVIETITIKHS